MKSKTPISLLAATTIVTAQQNYTCVDGLYMIVARGTGEDPGTGIMGTVGDLVSKKVEKSQVIGLDYPAEFSGDGYFESVKDGQAALKAQIEGYSKACPDGRIAVMGYSQGAQVTADVMCGGSGSLFDEETALTQDIADNNVVAILLYGDPSFVNGTSYDRGTGNDEGIFPRQKESVARCEQLSSKLASYCDYGDRYCDTGDYTNKTVHQLYVSRYGQESADWVVDRLDAFDKEKSEGEGPYLTTTTGTATVEPTATATNGAPAESTTAVGNGASGGTGGYGMYAVPLMILGLLQMV